MPMAAPSGYKLERKWSLTHFLIGVFGAMAILGVMAKIFNFEAEVFGYLVTWKPVVLVGFMGEAIVFILMGMLREMRYVPVDEEDEAEDTSASPFDSSAGEALDSDLRAAEETLTHEAERLAQEIQAARTALTDQLDVLEQLRELRNTLEQASEGLSKQSELLSSNMEDLQTLYDAQIPMIQSVEEVQEALTKESKELSGEIAQTRKAMQALRQQFARTARRFEQFNEPSSATERTNAAPNSAQHPS